MKQKSLSLILLRGLKGNCPNCGLGKIFKNWFVLNKRCSHCGCEFQSREDDTYFFMYMSTGFLTGLFIVAMFFVFPQDFRFAKLVLLFASVGMFLLTHPFRKGLAIAIDYFIEEKSDYPKRRQGG
ncbi:MAG: DUF983 domain-containing protein [Proteobacteria bacterium]|nr:DUF983 domain-containing protein [Pseudomonadota bacterium]